MPAKPGAAKRSKVYHAETQNSAPVPSSSDAPAASSLDAPAAKRALPTKRGLAKKSCNVTVTEGNKYRITSYS